MPHDNRSEGNRIDNVFVYHSFSRNKEDGTIQSAGFYRVDIHPDAAVGFGALEYDDWDAFEAYEQDLETPQFFIIKDDDTTQNTYGL